MEILFYGVIGLVVSIIFWFMCDYEVELLGICLFLGVAISVLTLFICLLISQSTIITVTEIQYDSIEISNDNEYLFVTNKNNKEVIDGFKIKFVDKTDKNYGKLVKTVVKSDESKFPNIILMSTQLESEKYIYYTNLK